VTYLLKNGMSAVGDMLGTGTGISSKRVLTTLATLLVFLVVIVDLFTDKHPSDYVFEGLVFIAISGLGSIALERFASVKSNKQPEYGYGGSYDRGRHRAPRKKESQETYTEDPL
jgi:hypothetical protein